MSSLPSNRIAELLPEASATTHETDAALTDAGRDWHPAADGRIHEVSGRPVLSLETERLYA